MANHKEAFCLMWYACKCGHRERIWNSRDGVTPFSCLCPNCKGTMYHVEWYSDMPASNHKLTIGQRFWRDGTPDESEFRKGLTVLDVHGIAPVSTKANQICRHG